MRSLFILFVSLVFTVIGCSSNTASGPAKTTEKTKPDSTTSGDQPTPNKKKDKSDSESSVFVIDVRSKAEWDAGHVKQAVHIPHTEIGKRISEVTDNKDAKIVVYCRVGGRAKIAKEKLEELGFTNVENGGGFNDVKGRFTDAK